MSLFRLKAACNFRNVIRVAATLLAMVCASVPAWAGSVLDLQIGSGGVFGYASGERDPWFYGSGIKVNDLMLGGNELPILKGKLSFSDRDYLGSSGGNYFWGPGGTLKVTGSLDGIKGILFTGTFLSAKLVDVNGTEMLEAMVKDQINSQLAALLHLSSTTYTGQLDLALSSLGGGRWWTRDRVQGGSLIDGNVPEASSIWLLAASLLGFGGVHFGRALLARFPLR